MSGFGTASDKGLESQLSSAFSLAEAQLIEVSRQSPHHLATFETELAQLASRAKRAIDQNALSGGNLRSILASSINIRSMASLFHNLENNAKAVENQLEATHAAILHDSSNQFIRNDVRKAAKVSKASSTEDAALAEATKFKPCCDYFLAHFGAPYPSNDVKGTLATEIGVEISSITMWFTNNRRRSGWNNIMRDHANNNKELMCQLINDVLNPCEARPVPEAVCEAVLNAKAFITRLSGDEISDVFREALAMEPMTAEELKAYTEERRKMQKRLADLKRTQEEREAHKVRKAARAKAREEKVTREAARGVSGAPIATSASVKRKRMAENEIVEVGHHDRPMKRPNTTASGVQNALVITSTIASSKRKRAEASGTNTSVVAPNDERAAKRVRASDTPPERKPRTRFVLDADGNPRRLRRKAQFRYRAFLSSPLGASLLFVCPFVLTCLFQGDATSTAVDTATPNIVSQTPTQVDDQQPSITPLVVRKRKHNHDTDPASAPCIRLPTTHKRRKAAPEVRSRVTSSLHKSQSPQPNSKSRKKRNYERSASAPTTPAPSSEVPFLMLNVDNAIRQANRVASGPSALVGLGAYVEGDAMLPPLTEEELALYIQPGTSEPIASGPATDDQITIDLDPNAFNNPFALNLNSSNVEFTLPPSDPSSTFTDTNCDGIDALLQMITPQNQLEIPMIGVDDLMLDPSQLNAQLSQLQAEQATQQQSFNVPFVPQPQYAPFFAPTPTPVYNPVPQVSGSFEEVLMNAFVIPQMPQQQVLAPAVTPFTPTISNSLSASSSFSSDFSGTSSFSVPSPPEEYAEPNTMSNSHPDSRVRSLSPAGSSGVSGAELYAEVERRKRELEDHLREYERKKAELGSIVTACAHSVIGSSDITA